MDRINPITYKKDPIFKANKQLLDLIQSTLLFQDYNNPKQTIFIIESLVEKEKERQRLELEDAPDQARR